MSERQVAQPGRGARIARRRSPLGRVLSVLAAVAVIGVLGILVGLVFIKRVETGAWSMPTGDDLVRVKRMLVPDKSPPRAIYLHRGPLALEPGDDDAKKGTSSVVASTSKGAVTLGGFKGKTKAWNSIVTCVKGLFAPFNIEITTERPTKGRYILVAVGGRPSDLGVDNRHVGGLAPFNGGVIPDAVVFAFSAALDNQVRPVCETIGMEVAHAFGLDHSYECKDVMTYRSGCGNKSFLDKDVPCGEKKARPCQPGERPAQNSYRLLMGILGPRPAVGTP